MQEKKIQFYKGDHAQGQVQKEKASKCYETWLLEWMAESLHPGMTQWIQYKLGKQYL